MGRTNEELIQEYVDKAITAASHLASAGKLNPEQQDQFLDYVFDETAMNGVVRTYRFRPEKAEINKIGVGRRVTVPAAEAVDPGVRRGVTTSKIELQPKECMTSFDISDIFKEINVEGESVEDHIVRMMGVRTGNDLEELGINGNALGPARIEADLVEGGHASDVVKDSLIALMDGWIVNAQTNGHLVDNDAEDIGIGVFGKMYRAMPNKYKRDMKSFRWLMSPDLWQLYLERLTTRGTPVGDAALQGGQIAPLGIQAMPIPLWSAQAYGVAHATLAGTTAVSLGSKNVTNVVVTDATLAGVATTPYVETTDYTVDYAAGTIVRVSGGNIADPTDVKVTFQPAPTIMLTPVNNLIWAIGRDIRIESDRDIHKRVDEYAITTKVDFKIENADAVVLAENIGAIAA